MVHGLGERLKEQRHKRKISQKDVATALGVSAAVISNYESSGRTPSVENLLALARLYRCSTDYLLGFEKYTPSTAVDVSGFSEEQQQYLQDFINSLNTKNAEK